jgi:hypothetical protein
MPLEHVSTKGMNSALNRPTRKDIGNSVILWISFNVVYGALPDVTDAASYRKQMAVGVCNLWASVPGLMNKHFLFDETTTEGGFVYHF